MDMVTPRNLLIVLASLMAFPGLLTVLVAVWMLGRGDETVRPKAVASAGAVLLLAGIVALALLNS